MAQTHTQLEIADEIWSLTVPCQSNIPITVVVMTFLEAYRAYLDDAVVHEPARRKRAAELADEARQTAACEAAAIQRSMERQKVVLARIAREWERFRALSEEDMFTVWLAGNEIRITEEAYGIGLAVRRCW